jgi:hypothetical protein
MATSGIGLITYFASAVHGAAAPRLVGRCPSMRFDCSDQTSPAKPYAPMGNFD